MAWGVGGMSFDSYVANQQGSNKQRTGPQGGGPIGGKSPGASGFGPSSGFGGNGGNKTNPNSGGSQNGGGGQGPIGGGYGGGRATQDSPRSGGFGGGYASNPNGGGNTGSNRPSGPIGGGYQGGLSDRPSGNGLGGLGIGSHDRPASDNFGGIHDPSQAVSHANPLVDRAAGRNTLVGSSGSDTLAPHRTSGIDPLLGHGDAIGGQYASTGFAELDHLPKSNLRGNYTSRFGGYGGSEFDNYWDGMSVPERMASMGLAETPDPVAARHTMEVMLNRAKAADNSLSDVMEMEGQFSPGFDKNGPGRIYDARKNPHYNETLKAAVDLASGAAEPELKNALNYKAPYSNPDWANPNKKGHYNQVAFDGVHQYYDGSFPHNAASPKSKPATGGSLPGLSAAMADKLAVGDFEYAFGVPTTRSYPSAPAYSWQGDAPAQVAAAKPSPISKASGFGSIHDPSQAVVHGAPAGPVSGAIASKAVPQQVASNNVPDGFDAAPESDFRTPRGYYTTYKSVNPDGSIRNLGNVNPKVMAAVKAIADGLGHPVDITSGGRDKAHNDAAKGAKHSQHLYDNAVDISGKNWSKEEALKAIEIASASGMGGIGTYNGLGGIKRGSGHLHIDGRPDQQAWGQSTKAALVKGHWDPSVLDEFKPALATHLSGKYKGASWDSPGFASGQGVNVGGPIAVADNAAPARPAGARSLAGKPVLSDAMADKLALNKFEYVSGVPNARAYPGGSIHDPAQAVVHSAPAGEEPAPSYSRGPIGRPSGGFGGPNKAGPISFGMSPDDRASSPYNPGLSSLVKSKPDFSGSNTSYTPMGRGRPDYVGGNGAPHGSGTELSKVASPDDFRWQPDQGYSPSGGPIGRPNNGGVPLPGRNPVREDYAPEQLNLSGPDDFRTPAARQNQYDPNSPDAWDMHGAINAPITRVASSSNFGGPEDYQTAWSPHPASVQMNADDLKAYYRNAEPHFAHNGLAAPSGYGPKTTKGLNLDDLSAYYQNAEQHFGRKGLAAPSGLQPLNLDGYGPKTAKGLIAGGPVRYDPVSAYSSPAEPAAVADDGFIQPPELPPVEGIAKSEAPLAQAAPDQAKASPQSFANWGLGLAKSAGLRIPTGEDLTKMKDDAIKSGKQKLVDLSDKVQEGLDLASLFSPETFNSLKARRGDHDRPWLLPSKAEKPKGPIDGGSGNGGGPKPETLASIQDKYKAALIALSKDENSKPLQQKAMALEALMVAASQKASPQAATGNGSREKFMAELQTRRTAA